MNSNWNGGAEFSKDRKHRFALYRTKKSIFDQKEKVKRILWIMLNPSTADEDHNDPTIRRCMGFSERWGYNHVEIANLFSLRSTDPKALMEDSNESYYASNMQWLIHVAVTNNFVVCGWGNHGSYKNRGKEVVEMLAPFADLHCLGITKNGHPMHPLYLPYEAKPFIYRECTKEMNG